jgi:2-succinyl-5-enolpyruvyl-6-hydroxy-3-cyclohexene-1-carboxylate synthase
MGRYSVEKNIQMLISLMKQHNIRKVIISPGMKNMPFIASVQFDSFFEVYSCVDERSAAYMACGMAVESEEPVALSCTGATASRNYISALTEAFYNNIPVLAITSMSHTGEIGHLIPQIIDRSSPLKDTVKMSVQINPIHSSKDEWDVNVKLNKALLELRHGNGGPVLVNLISGNLRDFTSTLVKSRKIARFGYEDKLPEISESSVAVFIGIHRKFDEKLTSVLDDFCSKYNGVVLCDNTSNYYGKYRVCPALLNAQVQAKLNIFNIDLVIHIGDISGSYISLNSKKVWRVNLDGEIRDTFKTLENVFEMSEYYFFKTYADRISSELKKEEYLNKWKTECKKVEYDSIELPFSNAWIASRIANKFQNKSFLLLGILNSLRNWNYFNIPYGITCWSNTGGFGIDGLLSTTIGAAISNPTSIHYVVLGDLAFFYDLNAIGNRHIPKNVRIILINNGTGIEFRNYKHPSAKFGVDADPFMAATGHFGNQSAELVKHYVTDLGFDYYSTSCKDEFVDIEDNLLSSIMTERPMLVEVFTSKEEEKHALEILRNIIHDISAKQIAKDIIGEDRIKSVKNLIKRR